jgi:hypothetical protein
MEHLEAGKKKACVREHMNGRHCSLNPNKYSSEGTLAKKHSTNYLIPKQMRTSSNNMGMK